ncbi:MAG TPA: hypothetical protein VGH84_05655 [Steroidobacteraceae bacterium]|jgi:hypothetical protein
MHKKRGADKKTRARNIPAKAGFRKTPSSVNDLLLRRATFRELATRIPEQQSWAEWLRSQLPAELASHVVNVVPKTTAASAAVELVVMADSPGWCARLRYAVAGLTAQIRERDAAVQQTRVRVSMA